MTFNDETIMNAKRRVRIAAGMILLAAVGLIWGTLVYVEDLEASFRHEVGQQLSTVAEMKASQIAALSKEWNNDATLFFSNPASDPVLRAGLNSAANGAVHNQVQALLNRTQIAHQYERVMLVDATGLVRMVTPQTAGTPPDVFGLQQDIRAAISSKKIRFVDLFLNQTTGEVRLATLVPVLAEREQDPPLGVLVLQQDPGQLLYPMVAQWPTNDVTAESILVRQEGDQALILNPLRVQPDAGMHLKFPMTRTDLPMVQAINGVRGIIEGIDFGGFPVIADVRDVPGTPWFMVSKIDTREALAPLQRSQTMAAGLLVALLAVLAILVAWIWRSAQMNVYRERYQAARAARELNRHTRLNAAAFNAIPDSLMVTDLGARIQTVNTAFTKISGYSEAEALGRTPRLLRAPNQDPTTYRAMRTKLAETGEWRGELLNQRKSGEVYPVLLSISTVRDDAGQPTHYVGVGTDISRLRETEAAVDRLASFDSLTGLPNRAQMVTRIDGACDLAGRNQCRFALLNIKLGPLQEVFASLGFSAADQVVRQASERLRQRLRAADVLARVGAADFLVLVRPGDPSEDAAIIARDLMECLSAEFALPNGHMIVLSASTGISLYPDDGADATSLIKNAESARLAARAAEQSFSFYKSEANAGALTRLELEADLRRAIANHELVLHYQPKVSLRSGEICGVEALIRWQRKDGRLVPPNDFIPIAERTKLILPIGQWVIHEACRQIRQWLDAGLPEIRVAVNVSAHQFRAGDLDQVLAHALAEHGVTPHSLEVELTESVLMEDIEKAAAMLRRVKATGVSLALDDFGTGYSSLAYLGRFPFDVLKIDRSFVLGVVTDPDAATIAMTIIDLAHRMRLKVVAEGVETEAQRGFFSKNGCDQMQGFLFSKPLPAAALTELRLSGKMLAMDTPDEQVRKTILLVDDEPSILSSLRRLLRPDGYRVLTAASGAEALELAAQHDVQVVLTDQRMPQMTGTELLHRMCVIAPDTVRMVLSGYTDLDTITQAVNEGDIFKFMTKPWDDDQLRANIRDAFTYSEAVRARNKSTS
jgi:diguanylate cyclase (GGDEF)-like protein/PAS domain S-box-containing protein